MIRNRLLPRWGNRIALAIEPLEVEQPFEALLFGTPTWPHVHVRRTWIIASAKLTSCHCRPKHSDMRRPVPEASSISVRSRSRRLSSTEYACSGVRIIASYPLVVLQRTKRIGFDSWMRGISPYRCLKAQGKSERQRSIVVESKAYKL